MKSRILQIKSQLLCIRWVDDKFEAHEDFVGLHHVDDITAATIVHVVTDTVRRMTLSMSMCRAQCYDGASNMKRVTSDIKNLSHELFICIAMAIV